MDRKRYMRDVYSKYWPTIREKTYGFLEYDRNLCKYICERVPNGDTLLEAAIGTGYPIADFLQKAGYSVYGIDISPDLIEKCRQLNPNINCKVGDAEDLDHPDDYFDCTYCFHSTWYFPNLNKAIDEMLRVTRPGGLVMFDIQNRNNKKMDSNYRRRLFRTTGMGRIIRYASNIATIMLRRKQIPIWSSVISEIPTYPENIYEHLKESVISDFQIMVRNEDGSIEARNELGSFEDFARLVFAITK